VIVGAFQTPDRRFLEYVDGSMMTDGIFYDWDQTFYSDIYGTGKCDIFPYAKQFLSINAFSLIKKYVLPVLQVSMMDFHASKWIILDTFQNAFPPILFVKNLWFVLITHIIFNYKQAFLPAKRSF
jgi:hypothetical protein